MKAYREWAPQQGYLMPPNPMDWVPAGHLVHFIIDIVERFDLSAIEATLQAKDPRGTRSYHPRMMVALLVYGYCLGIVSSRRLERATYEDVTFRLLCADQHPDHTRISEFRRENLEALSGLFLQVLRLCQEAGLVKLGRVALDGTKLQANASKHKAMSYKRMQRSAAELKAEIAELMKQAEEADRSEDQRFGVGQRGDELPEELQRRESRLAKITEAMAKLEAEAAAAKARERAAEARKAVEEASQATPEQRETAERKAERAEEKAEKAAAKAKEKAAAAGEPEPELERRPGDVPSHQVQATAEGDPAAKAQRNFTDPESRIMKAGGGFVQGYNCQAAVDEPHQIIVAHLATNQAPDVEHLPPMLSQVEANCGAVPDELLADAGYWSEANAQACKAKGVDAYLATGRSKHAASADGEAPPPSSAEGKAKEEMSKKLKTPEGRAAYARRKAIVEPVFGQTKEARGLRRLLLRGLNKVRAEWTLICMGHNLLKLFRATAATAG